MPLSSMDTQSPFNQLSSTRKSTSPIVDDRSVDVGTQGTTPSFARATAPNRPPAPTDVPNEGYSPSKTTHSSSFEGYSASNLTTEHGSFKQLAPRMNSSLSKGEDSIPTQQSRDQRRYVANTPIRSIQQTTIGAIGDGRRFPAVEDYSLPAEIEQTALLLRSLDITPPPSGLLGLPPSPMDTLQKLPPLNTGSYGLHLRSLELPPALPSMYNSFAGYSDTPVTLSPATPTRGLIFDPIIHGTGSGLLTVDGNGPITGQISPEATQGVHPSEAVAYTAPTGIISTTPTNLSFDSSTAGSGNSLFDLSTSGSSNEESNILPAPQEKFPQLPNNLSAKLPSSIVDKRDTPQMIAISHNSHPHFAISKPIEHMQMKAPGSYVPSPSPYWQRMGASTNPSTTIPHHGAIANRIPLGYEMDNTRAIGDWVSHLPYSCLGSEVEDRRLEALYPFNQSAGDTWSTPPSHWSSHVGRNQTSTYRGGNTVVVDGLSTTPSIQSLAQLNPLVPHRSNSFSAMNPSLPRGTAKHSSGSASIDAHPKAWLRSYDSVPWFTPPVISLDEETKILGLGNTGILGTNRDAGISRPNASAMNPSLSSSDLSSVDLPSSQGINSSIGQQSSEPRLAEEDENLNFLQLLQPNARPPYHVLVYRIVKKSDQQASIFIQQKLKNASTEERTRIVNAIVERGQEMMQGRFGNWCVQRCLESPCTRDDRMKIVKCMVGRVVELATNCYGTHVVQKALECEEDIKRIIVGELLANDPAYTLTSKHCSHVWAKVMELSWHEGPAPPIFPVVNRSLRGKWASLACHETGSLVVQTMFENMDDVNDKRVIVDEILENLDDVVKNQWGAFVVQHIIEHGSADVSHRTSLSLISNIAAYGTHDIAVKSILKILKEKDSVTREAIISKMCEPNINNGRNKRPIIVDLALSANGSQIIQAVLPDANKDQRARLYEAVKGHTVTLRGCKTGSRVIWLFDRMRAYYGY
ncbi:ARM repeat-containing protein [Serendipita vermifera]|nr:ARM repeat-containing protein [Serendipita vermifera]